MELLHFGVKGMKWGVKKAYVNRVSKQTAHIGRVAEGTGSKVDKARVALGASAHDLAKGRGLKGAATLKNDRIQGHLDRVEHGKKTLKDTLALVGGVSFTDIAKGAKLAKQAPK